MLCSRSSKSRQFGVIELGTLCSRLVNNKCHVLFPTKFSLTALTRPNGLEETLKNQSRQGVSNPSVPTLSQLHFTPVDSPDGLSDDEEDEDDDDSSRSSPIDV